MLHSSNSTAAAGPARANRISGIRKKLAKAMIGSTVDLLADSHTVAHGIVTGVFLNSENPKIIVNGRTYDLDRVITATSVSM